MKSSPPEPVAARAPPQRADQVLKRLEWTVIRRLDGLLQGDYRTLMRGTGMDLADLREYQHNDDVRHIDWNVTARLLTRHGNRVGAMLYGAGVDQVLPARSGRLHVLQLLHLMLQRPLAGDQAGSVTRLHELLQSAGNLMRRRSTVFVVSDFISEPGWEKALAHLAQRHEVLAVRLLDPMELELPDLGLIPIRDAETGEQLMVDTSDAGFRKRFARIAAQREAELRASLVQAGVDTLELSTDDDLVNAIMRFADLRKRRSRLASGAGGLPTHLQPAAAAHARAA